jgi:hypothetical protein
MRYSEYSRTVAEYSLRVFSPTKGPNDGVCVRACVCVRVRTRTTGVRFCVRARDVCVRPCCVCVCSTGRAHTTASLYSFALNASLPFSFSRVASARRSRSDLPPAA